MTRYIIIFFICIFFFLFWPINNTAIPVFLISSEQEIITKGNANNAFIIAVSFEHDDLKPFIEQHSQLPITYLVTTDLLKRSPDLVKTLKKQRPIIGLLGNTNETYEEKASILDEQIESFQSYFDDVPMYFMTEDAMYSQQLVKSLSKKQINALSPTLLSSYNYSPKKGEILFIHLNRDEEANFKQLDTFLKKHSFSSIEETIFDATISSSTKP